ncbi:hypothetical protein GS907_24695 [Rhodococcus hoagii]|nr:hypothetical protein [Prescottella equi]
MATIAALFVLGLVIEFWWLIVGACVIAAAAYVAHRGWRARQRRVALEEQARAELAARADLEHQQYLAGEPRGLYGGFEPARLD